jgi:hypothetical protein
MTTKAIKILLTIFLVSCQHKTTCLEIKTARIRPVITCDISFQFKTCSCRCFNVNDWEKISDKNCKNFTEGDYPLETCDGIAGFFLDDIATEIKPKIKKLASINRDNCK